MKKYKNHAQIPTYGFTLVELIVVITILAILGTIGFISIQGYSSSARDSSRISNLVNLHKGLALFQVVGGSYPMPETPITITASGTIFGYQGFAKDQVAGIAKLSAGATRDPLDPSIYTTYATNALQTKMQLMNFLEDGSKVTAYVEDTFAATSGAYASRSPLTKGDTIGILIGTGSSLNQPVQELLTASFTGIDIVTTNTGYTMYLNKFQQFSGTGMALKANIVGDGLIGYWGFDESTGITAYDKSGNGNNGTLSGAILPTWSEGKMGGGLSFGGGGFVNIPHSKSLDFQNNSVTLHSCFKTSIAGDQLIFEKGGFGGPINGIYFGFYVGTLRLQFDDGGNQPTIFPSSTPYIDNAWHCTTGVLDRLKNTEKLYVDGKLVSQGDINNGYSLGSIDGGGKDLWIGKSLFFQGSLDEIRIYNRALSDSEIATLYNTAK